jgi:nitrate reductase NapE component
MGRSVKGTLAPGRVAVADADGADGSVVAETEFKLLVVTAEGLTPAVAVALVAAVVGFVVGGVTGRGPDIGVSYRIYTVLAFHSRPII